MANTPRRGDDCAPVMERHGRAGEVTLTVGVPPWLKDRLVELAEREGLPLKYIVRHALEKHVG